MIRSIITGALAAVALIGCADRPADGALHQRLARGDRNHNGKLELGELAPNDRDRLASADRDGDGAITLQEFVAARDARWLDGLRAADRDGGGGCS